MPDAKNRAAKQKSLSTMHMQRFEMIPEHDARYVRSVQYARTHWQRLLYRGLVTIAILLFGYGALIIATSYNKFSADYEVHLQIPVQNWIVISPRTAAKKPLFKVAKAAPDTFEDKVREAFGTHADTFIHIARMESGHQAGAKGWNCFYINGKGERYSTSCQEQDRGKAWSVDCGALQINVYGQKCPPELYDLDTNLKAAIGKFERQGFGAWSVCNQKKVICK